MQTHLNIVCTAFIKIEITDFKWPGLLSMCTEMCYCKIFCISYKDHVSNKVACAKIQQAIRSHEDILTIVKEMQTEVVWTCLPFIRSGPKPFCKAQWKGEEDKADRRRCEKTTSGYGQKWKLTCPRRQWKNGQNWFWSHLWCQNAPLS